MTEFIVDSARVESLAATRAGRISLAGYAYQFGYSMARLAGSATGLDVLDLDDPPTAIRLDWSDDLEELLVSGRVLFTQCKRIDDAMAPARMADIMLGFAPKLLWSAGANAADIGFRLASPDSRFRRERVEATNCGDDYRAEVRRFFLARLASPPANRSDRALWHDEAVAWGADSLFSEMWSRLQFVHASAAVKFNDPAGPILAVERAALNVLLAGALVHPSLQQQALGAMRNLLHGNLVEFDPTGNELVEHPPTAPRTIRRGDVLVSLFSFGTTVDRTPPFHVVDRPFLEAQKALRKRPFVARFPSWADVVDGENEETGFIDRDATAVVVDDLTAALTTARHPGPDLPMVVLTGAPGAGKSTLVRRASALKVLAGECVVADFGARLDQMDDDLLVLAADGIARLKSAGLPVLVLLDDPFFVNSPWLTLLTRFGAGQPSGVAVAAASPQFLFQRYRHLVPRRVAVTEREVDGTTPSERARLAAIHGRALAPLTDTEDQFLVLAMQAAAGQPFDDIIDSLWRTLNLGANPDPDSKPAELPWALRAYAVAAWFHRNYVVCREPLLRSALRCVDADLPDGALTDRTRELVDNRGWHLFAVDQPGERLVAWAGAKISTAHALIAQRAFARSPVRSHHVEEWVFQAVVADPAGIPEVATVLATQMKDGDMAAAAMVDRLALAWSDGIRDGSVEVRNVAMFVANGVAVFAEFPRCLEAMRRSVERLTEQSWIGALQMYLSSSDDRKNRRFPDDLPLREVALRANYAIAPSRAFQFLTAMADVPDGDQAWQTLRAAVAGDRPWRPNSHLLTYWLTHDDPSHVESQVDHALQLWEAFGRPLDVSGALRSAAKRVSSEHGRRIRELTEPEVH